MIVIAALVLGAVFGVFRARKLQGNRLDMAQYAAGYAVAFAVAALFLTVLIERSL